MSTTATDRAWCVIIPHRPWGVRIARHRLLAALGGLLGPELLHDVEAVASELIGNAVRHAEPLPGGVVRVAWRLRGGCVEVRVSDGGSTAVPKLLRVPADAVDGRGLTIVAGLSRRWGFERDGLGQCVWALLG